MTSSATVHDDDVNITHNVATMMTSHTVQTTIAPDRRDQPLPFNFLTSAGLITLLVLMALCAILGAIYAYIYYTRINPRSRTRKYTESGIGMGHMGGDDDHDKVKQTHLFMFKRS